MKILVTGHRGFIGSHVYEHLTELGFDVDGYDIPYDIGDFKTNKKYDVVIHLAANAAIREALKDPDAFVRTSFSTHFSTRLFNRLFE